MTHSALLRAVKTPMLAYVAEDGPKVLQAAVSGGPYEHPQGLFYGGRNPTWSQQTLRHVLQDHGLRCARLGWIDLHSGLGPSGHGERIYAGPDDAAALAHARQRWGEMVTSMYDGSSESALLTGLMWLAADQECPNAEATGSAMEYGTLLFDHLTDALRADRWLENHPDAPHAMRVQIKCQVRDAFYVDAQGWKSRVLEQGIEAAHQAVAALGR